MAHLIIYTLESGVPLYYCSFGKNTTPIANSTLNSLNGLHLFAQCQNKTMLTSAEAPGTKICWRIFENTYKLILVKECYNYTSDALLERLIEFVHNGILGVLGQSILEDRENHENISRNLPKCNAVLQTILDPESRLLTPLLNAIPVNLPSKSNDHYTILGHLDIICDHTESKIGFFYMNDSILVATGAWWALAFSEKATILHIVSSEIPFSSIDIPIYLIKSSPKIPLRLVGLSLTPSVHLILICGSQPNITVLLNSILPKLFESHCENLLEQLNNTSFQYLSEEHTFLNDSLGYLLVNTTTEISLTVILKSNTKLNSHEIQHLLAEQHEVNNTQLNSKESYVCYSEFKVFRITKTNYTLISIYGNNVSTYSLRLLAYALFDNLLSSINI